VAENCNLIMKNNKKTNFIGLLVVILILIISFLLYFVINFYHDFKKVSIGVHNVQQELRSTREKIADIDLYSETSAQGRVDFTEVTKHWQVYQNDEFDFQFKFPSDWGEADFSNYSTDEQEENVEKEERRFTGVFENLLSRNGLNLFVSDYGFEGGQDYSSADIQKILLLEKLGECSDRVFTDLKDLNIGEIRNCFIQQNILNQKFILFRNVDKQEGENINQQLAVYPREDYYLTVFLSDEYNEEINFFVQSIVFLK